MSELGMMALWFLGQARGRNRLWVEFVFNGINGGISIHSNRERLVELLEGSMEIMMICSILCSWIKLLED